MPVLSGTLRVTALTVLGGTVAKIGGGNFANGAISAAFQQLFNQAGEDWLKSQRAATRERMIAKYASVLAVLHTHGVTLSSETLIAGNISNAEFIKDVHTHGIWDCKNSSRFAHFKNRALLTSFGNVNFGFVAHAHGWSLGVTVAGAGLYQFFHQGYSSFHYRLVGAANLVHSLTINKSLFIHNDIYAAAEINYNGVRFGDNPGDSREIETGYNLYGN
ncbi:MAG: polymorphic toxin type 44 domain-containing protein [Gammaproteobacteria bacterium]